MKEHAVNMETLNVVQQVMKAGLLAIAAATQADPARVATFLEAFLPAHPGLDSRAQAMLADIAAGFAALSDNPRH